MAYIGNVLRMAERYTVICVSFRGIWIPAAPFAEQVGYIDFDDVVFGIITMRAVNDIFGNSVVQFVVVGIEKVGPDSGLVVPRLQYFVRGKIA